MIYLTDQTGKHGLEAAPADLTPSQWGCMGTTIGGTSSAIGTGKANTAAIVAGCADTDTAAKAAANYTLNGYNDWYLPSEDELNLLYMQKQVLDGIANDSYWSSTEGTSGNTVAQGQYFGDGTVFLSGNKNGPIRVRAIRSF